MQPSGSSGEDEGVLCCAVRVLLLVAAGCWVAVLGGRRAGSGERLDGRGSESGEQLRAPVVFTHGIE